VTNGLLISEIGSGFEFFDEQTYTLEVVGFSELGDGDGERNPVQMYNWVQCSCAAYV
jgi:hypothetical protein